MERPFTDGNAPDLGSRGRLGGVGGVSDLGGLGGGPIGGSVPAGLGGSMGGLLGSGENWGPGRPRRLHSQRRYRARGGSRPDRSPAVEGWATAAQFLPPLSSDICFIYLCSARQNCTAVSYQPFCQLWSSWLASLLVVRWHISVTRLLVFFQIKSCFSPSLPFTRTGMLHSNPGDYAWGQGGLDAVITQVCEM